MEPLKHECGVAMIRLRKPLSYFQQKYGSWTYGLNKLYLMMEKQHNRGQEGAGLACLKMHAVPGEEFIFRERALGAGGIEAIFENVKEKVQKYTPEQTQDINYITHHLPYAGEIYMGHLRYSTTGKSGLSYVHPFLRRSNWRAKNLCICANFNMTNVPEIFGSIATKGQHPRMMSDTYILLEQLGHRLDRESERCYVEAKSKGLKNTDITRYIEENIDVANILKSAAPVWDGGYAIMGVTGSGECFTMRDPWGIRPCFWYMNDEFLAVASERPVLQTTFDLEVDDIHELTPGQAILMRENGEMRLEQILPQRGYHACSFEHVYFSRGSDCDIYRERKEMGRRLVNPVLKAINGELDNTVISYIPNTAEASFYGLVQGFNEYLNEQKIKDIELLGSHPQPEELRRILSRRVRSEKVAWKDIKLRTFIAEGNSRKDLAAHVYDITYESLVAYKDNLVIIDDSIVRGTTLRESVIRILDRLHPKRIVIVSASPQVRYPDFYGIDMPDLGEFISFRAIIALLKQYGKEDIIRSVYKRCKEQEGRPKEEMQEYVRELYAECSADEISKKTAELLRPEGVQTEIHIVYQTLEGLHKACPLAPGDWYFSGHYPTPGGRMRVNQAFINFYERNEAQLNQKQFNL
ncbi:MAG: amidophosphoribosyltransferase [Alloprevotella tannerae]|uniref:amidophosphoribosyltransferase n=1 Tax=Alloprevotella tannerae TaxID=76122 RepID=UPI0028ECCC83|nr:amidophosphoribosyltransferase [Alloprevotella tannerae]